MKTIDLTAKHITVEELFKLAAKGSVRILSTGGKVFVLEPADDFDREVQLLGKSKKFMRFLDERSKEEATISLEQYLKSLET